ncbi:MAG TPA: DUF4124 domain-containing protein [Gammaproteobacteria bacterium]|nr:DUF4124 domain-containing protein [Gammaproteobacteria bacterium]
MACLLALWMGSAAWARMYQWVDPHSGRTHMSGTPPAWYRTGATGPRIFVFENGQIIDDTRITVGAGTRQALRKQAFKNAAPVTPTPDAAGDTTTPVAPVADDAAAAATAPAADTPMPQNVSPEVMNKLKQALERWDQTHSSDLSLPAPTPPSP